MFYSEILCKQQHKSFEVTTEKPTIIYKTNERDRSAPTFCADKQIGTNCWFKNNIFA